MKRHDRVTPGRALWALSLALAGPAALVVGCNATLSPDTTPATASGGSGGTGGSAGGGGAGQGGSGGGTVDPPRVCDGKPVPGPVFLRRLTNWEYDNTVADLLGYKGRASIDFDLAPDARATNDFDNRSESISLTLPIFDRYESAAMQLATKQTASASTLKATAGCDPAADAACLPGFVDRFGKRAFRRPLTAEERADLLNAASAGPTPAEKIANVIHAVLLSPNFIFRPEVGEPDPSRPGLVRLTGPEIATRLSYTLLGTTPSDDLLAGAMAGKLSTPEGVEEAARKMLADPRAKQAIKRFYTQWFSIDALQGASFDSKLYPKWTPKLGEAMLEETSRFLDAVFAPGGRYLDILDANYSFLNADLAKHYGVDPPAKDWDKVVWPASAQRQGLISQGSVLTITSKPDHVSAILRGKFVRHAIMCSPIPDPPTGVPALEAPLPGETERDRFDRHTKDPACSVCHVLMDPVGFGLDRYDATGALRTLDDQKKPVTGKGRIAGSATQPDLEFEGVTGLTQRLAERGDVPACATTHALRFLLGRHERTVDTCTVQDLTAKFAAANYSVPELLVAFVTSDAFRYREPVSAQKGEIQ